MTYVIDRADLARLDAEVAGPVVAPGDKGYQTETATWNRSLEQRPAVAVGATSAADVQAAVRFAGANGLPVATVATGHGAVVPSDGAVMINIRRLNDISIDTSARTATIGGAVQAQDLVEASEEHDLAFLAGSSPNVGVVGYSLGGGLSSTLGRVYGFAADHVRSAELVSPDGSLRRIDAEHDPDLFWAIRGGTGNFGVVTSLTFDLMPVTQLFGGSIYFAGEHVEAVLDAYRRLVDAARPEMTVSFAFLRLPTAPSVPGPLQGRFSVHVRVSYLGPPDEGQRMVADLRAAAPALLDTVMEMPFTGIAAIHADPVEPAPTYETSALLSDFPAEAARALIAAGGPDVDTPAGMIEVRQLGGALGRAPQQPNAVGNRDAGFQLFGAAFGEPGHEEEFGGPLAALSDAMAPWETGGKQANFLSGYDATPKAAYEPDTYRRLVEIKRAVDPQNMFRVNHNIAPN